MKTGKFTTLVALLVLTCAVWPGGDIRTDSVDASGSHQADSVRLLGVRNGDSVRGALDERNPFRLYWFEAQTNDQVTVLLDRANEFAPLLSVYDAAFVEQARVDAGATLTTTLSTPGLFFLAVSLPDATSTGGSYGFEFYVGDSLVAQGDVMDLAYGESARGTIDADTPAITYRFRGSAGDTVTVTMSRAGGNLNSYLYLLDANGQLLYEDNDSGGENGDARMIFSLPADGEYFVFATRLGQASGTTSGSFLLDLLSDSPPPVIEAEAELTLPEAFAGLPEIDYGDGVEGTISNESFLQVYVFAGTAGEPIVAEMNSLDDESPNSLDPLLVLLDDERIPLAENDDIISGQVRDSRIEYVLPETGYYAIVATRFEQGDGVTTGTYRLTLRGPGTPAPVGDTLDDLPPVRRLAPLPLVPGEVVEGTFGAAARWFSFTTLVETGISLVSESSGGESPALILADQNLIEVTSSQSGQLADFAVPESGRYALLVAPALGPAYADGGEFTLVMSQSDVAPVEEETPDGPQLLVMGETTSGIIDDEIVSRFYTFVGVTGESVQITMRAAPDSTLDSYLALQNVEGETIAFNDDIQAGVIRDAQIITELPADGEYVIIASRYVGNDADLTEGAYLLSLEHAAEAQIVDSTREIVPLSYGQTATGEINDDIYVRFYVFEGMAGDIISVSVEHQSGDLDSVLHLFQASGSDWVEIATNDDSPLGATYEALLRGIILPQTGKYLIAVSRYGLAQESTSGTYSLTLTRQ